MEAVYTVVEPQAVEAAVEPRTQTSILLQTIRRFAGWRQLKPTSIMAAYDALAGAPYMALRTGSAALRAVVAVEAPFLEVTIGHWYCHSLLILVISLPLP